MKREITIDVLTAIPDIGSITAGGKLTKAESLGVRILTEDEFEEMIR